MKVLVADKIAPEGVEKLREREGFEVVEAYGSTPEQILELAKDVHAIIVRSETKVTADVLKAATQLKAIGRAGVGVDNIDVEAATSRGVIVMNTPGGNTIATAELTFTHMLCATRPICQAYAAMREGRWDRKKFAGSELFGKTLGVLGLGRIGTEVAKRAKAFGMVVLAYDPFLTEERAEALDVRKVDLDEIWKEADYITVHMPKNEKTAGMINKESIAKMKDGVRLLNVARGGIIDEDDLLEALKSGKVGAAGLDVYDSEPLAEDHPFRELPNIVTTPHLGASTEEAQKSVGIEIAENIADALSGGRVRNALNMPSVDPRQLKILAPYINLGERLGALLQQICPEEIKKIRVTYSGHVVELDAQPLTRSIQRGYLRRISDENLNDVNAPHIMRNLGIEGEVTKTTVESDYTDLIRLEAICPDGTCSSVDGTMIGNSQNPRLVAINGYTVEAELSGTLLIYKNKDVPGIVGWLGTLLGKASVNIANMSLSRNAIGDIALTVVQLDQAPDEATLDEIRANENVQNVHVVELW